MLFSLKSELYSSYRDFFSISDWAAKRQVAGVWAQWEFHSGGPREHLPSSQDWAPLQVCTHTERRCPWGSTARVLSSLTLRSRVSEMPSLVLKCFWCHSRPSHVKGPTVPRCHKAEERSTLTRLGLEAAANFLTGFGIMYQKGALTPAMLPENPASFRKAVLLCRGPQLPFACEGRQWTLEPSPSFYL